MHLVCTQNRPIRGEESWCKRFAHLDATVRTLTALPGLRQASPVQCLHLPGLPTQCVSDVIGQKSCILQCSFSASNASSLHAERTNRRRAIGCATQGRWWCSAASPTGGRIPLWPIKSFKRYFFEKIRANRDLVYYRYYII